MKKVREQINNVIYSTDHARVHKVVEDNCKRQSIYFLTTSRGKPFIFLVNPYGQEFEVKYDNGDVETVRNKEKIFPVIYSQLHDRRNLEKYWKEHIV